MSHDYEGTMDDETRETFNKLIDKALETVDIHEMTLDQARALGEHLGGLAWTMTIGAGKAIGDLIDEEGQLELSKEQNTDEN